MARKKEPTSAQLRKFVEVRNKSQFQSNLQFQIDARACGFSVDGLGTPIKIKAGYVWQLQGLNCELLEEHGVMRIRSGMHVWTD